MVPIPNYRRGPQEDCLVGLVDLGSYRGIEMVLRKSGYTYFGASPRLYANAVRYISTGETLNDTCVNAGDQGNFYREAMLHWDCENHCFLEPQE